MEEEEGEGEGESTWEWCHPVEKQGEGDREGEGEEEAVAGYLSEALPACPRVALLIATTTDSDYSLYS